MPTLSITRSDIPLWSGANGSLALTIDADPERPVTPGSNPVLDASFQVDGGQDIAFAATGAVGIGIRAGAHARIVPIFRENAGTGADLVERFSLASALGPDNLLLAFEVGAGANLSAQGSFNYSVLSANATLEAGADATYVAVRSFPRTQGLQPMLLELTRNLTLPARVTRPPAPGDLVSFEFGGQLSFGVSASAGYELKGTHSFKVSEIALSERYALSVIGKLSLTGQVAGRFSVDVGAGSAPGFARVVVRRRRRKELQFAADVSVKAALATDGLPASGKEFLGALLGIQGKNWLNLVDGLVTGAGQVDSIDALKAKLDGLATDYLGAFAGKAIDQLTAKAEVKAFQQKLAAVVDSYRKVDARAIALYDRYFDPALDRTGVLEARLEELRSLTTFDRLQGEVDPVLWNVLRQLTDGDPLGWILGTIPGTNEASLPELQRRVDATLALIEDEAHQAIRDFIKVAKEQFKLDPFLDQIANISTPDALKALAGQKLGHFVERLIGDAVDALNGAALKKAFAAVRDVAGARDKFLATFDRILEQAAAQSFTLDLHAAYNSATEESALIDMEVKLHEPDGAPNATGLRLMQAAGRGDFAEALAHYQPAVVRLREGLLTHRVATSTTLAFNVAGWHRSFNYQSMQRVIVDAEQQIRDSGAGLLTVFTSVDMRADSSLRKRGSRGEETVFTNFLLRFLGETRVEDSSFDEQTERYAIDVITGMTASYGVTFTDTDTSSAELEDYLLFARQLGLDKVGATREGLAPVLQLENGSFGATASEYLVRYTEVGIRRLIELRPSAAEVRQILRRIVLANYFSHPVLHDVGWLYASDDVRALFDDNPAAFRVAESVLGGASVRLSSPIPGLLPPSRFSNTPIVRNDVATLFGIEDRVVRAFSDLGALLRSAKKVKTADLEKKLKSFGDALQSFDGFDRGENSVFAVFDGLILLASDAAQARSSGLTFKASKGGAEHTMVFTLRAVRPNTGRS